VLTTSIETPGITARSDRPYVRESLPDRGLDAWLLVDVTRSLDWGTARSLKRQLGLELAVLAGQLLIARGNRVGALLFDQRVKAVIPPAAGRTALLQMIARIERTAAAPASATDLGQALTQAGRLIRRRKGQTSARAGPQHALAIDLPEAAMA